MQASQGYKVHILLYLVMNKEKIFWWIAGIGFYGIMLHPIMLIMFLFGVWGMNRYGKEENNIR